MADDIDRATSYIMQTNENAVGAVRNLLPPEKHRITEDDLICDVCGEENSIPPERAAKGYTTCVPCRQIIEKMDRGFGKGRNRHHDD